MNIKGIEKLIAMLGAFADNENVVIAGGAVRDYYLGRPIKDIDFIVSDEQSGAILPLIEKATGRKLHLIGEDGNYEGRTFALYRSEDSKVEAVVTEDHPLEYVADFDDDISRMWVDKFAFHAYPEALNAAATKVIEVKKGAAKRFEKLKAKFPDYEVRYAA